jgi:sugar O-acyltransferase (sialic acid O-acetyltransferase NeuD family)
VADKLIIIGDSLFAQIAYEYFTHDSPYEVVGFAVEAEYRKRDELLGLPIVDFGTLTENHDPAEHDVYAALVYTRLNRLRARLAGEAKRRGFGLASYVSTNAFVWPNAQIGEHCFIFEDNTIQPFVTVGSNVVMWSGNHIGHHATIGDNVFISSHVVVSGSVDVGENSFLGVNSTFVNDITIGPDTWIGPHVVVTRDVEPGSVYRPARSDKRDMSSLELFGIET